MRSKVALSLAFASVVVACGGRTQVDDLVSATDHNQTLTGGSGGTNSAQGGASAAGKSGATSIGGSGVAGTGPSVGFGGAGPSTTGTGGAFVGGGGTTAQGGIGAAAGSSPTTAGKGGTTGKGGSGTAGASTGTGGSGTGAFGGACNPVAQKSCAPGEKCSAEQKGMGNLSTSCVNVMGGVGEGMDCKRMGIGHDNCAPGLVCTGVGVIDYDAQKQPPHRQCRKYCKTDGDCGMTQGCTQFTQDGFGVCVDSCLPFSACDPAPPTVMGSAGNNGGADKTCASVLPSNDGMNQFVTCHTVGKGNFNSQCQNEKDCGPGYFCVGGGPGGGMCQELCDALHPCDQKSAMCSANQPGELGVCQ